MTITTVSSTASETFSALAALVADRMQPPPRAAATAATLRQIAGLPTVAGLPLDTASATLAFRLLSVPAAADEPAPVQGRRKTCAELGDLYGVGLSAEVGPEQAPALAAAGAVWRAVAAAFAGSDDPRRAAIAATWGREAAEIESHLLGATVAERIAAAVETIAGHPGRRDVHISTGPGPGGRYLVAAWSWSDDALRAMGLDATRDILSVGGVTLPEPLRLRLRDAPAFARALAERGIRVNDCDYAQGTLARVFGLADRAARPGT